MRLPRVKPVGTAAVFHCTSHLVHEAEPLEEEEKEFLHRRMKALARFCQLLVIDYSFMENHFHIVVRAPEAVTLDDGALLQRLKEFYGPGSEEVRIFKGFVGSRSKRAEGLRRKYLRRMGDVSVFMKELKEGFTRYYNGRHQRRGALWSARFGSVLVEEQPSVLSRVASYVDNNAVQAWMVDDPKEHRFCGYTAALSGDAEAREGLRTFLPPGSWSDQMAWYRQYLFLRAAEPSHSRKRALDPEVVLKVVKAGGKLTAEEEACLKVRYVSDGGILGNREFVENHSETHRKKHALRRKSRAWPMRGGFWNGLYTMKNLGTNVFSTTPRPKCQ